MFAEGISALVVFGWVSSALFISRLKSFADVSLTGCAVHLLGKLCLHVNVSLVTWIMLLLHSDS